MSTKQFPVLPLVVSFLLIGNVLAHPLCINGDGGPQRPTVPLEICSDYNDSGCCTTSTEKSIQAELEASGVEDPKCLKLLQQVLCSRCDSWSAHLFDSKPGKGVVEAPFLCSNYCNELWVTCNDVIINGNPFDIQKRSISLAELYGSQPSFCEAYKTKSGQYCYSGSPFQPTVITDGNFTETICLDMILDYSTYIVMAVTPVSGDNRLFFGSQSGKIEVFDKNTQAIVGTFLDITSKTFVNGETGMHGLAFHPDYQRNGLFYITYSCPPSNPNCQWRCDRGCPYGSCKADGYCENLSHVQVIEEYKVMGDWSSNTASPTSIRRILEYPHPYPNHNGGDLHFGPQDGHLYASTGDGGNQNDPFYASQNLGSLLGKVVRIDVNGKENNKEYAVPKDNPYRGNNEALPEIWAYGFRNPYRFSFDKETGAMWLGDVGGAVVEEINIITKGGNYGWARYEGNEVRRADEPDIPDRIAPTISYYRSFIDPASVIGGYVYRANKNLCLQGSYIFADYFGVLIQGKETVPGGDIWNFSKVSTKCTSNSAKECKKIDNIFSFGQDRDGDVYIMANDVRMFPNRGPVLTILQLKHKAVFRIADSNQCGLTCAPQIQPPVEAPFSKPSTITLPPLKLTMPTVVPTSESVGFTTSNSFAFVFTFAFILYCI